jgi:adenylate cyclase
VTVLFSDLSGYTAMTEKLDPETVRKIMTRIFDKISLIIAKYDGFIERYVGDSVMAVFGIPRAHEDDAIRAIRAAMEIHQSVEATSPWFPKALGPPIPQFWSDVTRALKASRLCASGGHESSLAGLVVSSLYP